MEQRFQAQQRQEAHRDAMLKEKLEDAKVVAEREHQAALKREQELAAQKNLKSPLHSDLKLKSGYTKDADLTEIVIGRARQGAVSARHGDTFSKVLVLCLQ
jgi:hypothetical protein